MNSTEKKWWKEAVVYQIYPRSFMDSNGDGIGDLKGIIEKIPYLKELGVNVVWLSPIYQSPNDDNGYDISDYRRIMDEFGTMDDFQQLLTLCHEAGIRLVMDLVVNHTSDEHAWFAESRKDRTNPYRDYYIWRDPADGKAPNNWGSCFGGSAWQFDEQTGQYYLHFFSKKQPDLNWENENVRNAVYDMMKWWLDKGVDGFRMDVISLISKDQEFKDGEPELTGYSSFNVCANGPRVHEFLQEMRRKVLSKYDLLTVGECTGGTLEEAKKYASSDEKELNMAFQFEHVTLDADTNNKWGLKPLNLVKLKEIMTKWQVGLEGKAWNSLFWCNHDQPRMVSRWGNDREYREISAKMLATCLHMMQGTPYVYQGEELAMTNMPFQDLSEFRDLDSINGYHEMVEVKKLMTSEEMLTSLRKKSRDNSRTPMQWDDSTNAGFSTGTPWIKVNPNYTEINAREQLQRPDSVFHYYQKLIQLRKQHEIIVYGKYELLDGTNPDVYAYTRALDNEKLLIVCNFTSKELDYPIPELYKDGSCLISNYPDNTIGNKLRPYEAYVLHIEL